MTSGWKSVLQVNETYSKLEGLDSFRGSLHIPGFELDLRMLNWTRNLHAWQPH